MSKWEFIEPYPGAHIRVQVGNIYHHGIYIGDNMVVQFGMPFNIHQNPEEVKVIKSPIEDFLSNGFLEVRIFDKKEKKLKHSDNEIIKTALSMIGEGGYNILHNNCEHFANYCVFGRKTSSQVDSVHEEVRKMLGL